MAFRHLKTTLQIEHIKKFSLHRILQLTYGCLILYNLASMLRNLVQQPRLFPAREGTKVYCFELAIEFADLFCLAVLYRVRGQLRAMRRRLWRSGKPTFVTRLSGRDREYADSRSRALDALKVHREKNSSRPPVSWRSK